MKLIAGVLLLIFLLVAGVNCIAASCDNGAISGTLTVEMFNYPAGSEGHFLYMVLYPRGPGIVICAVVASGELLIGTVASTVLESSFAVDENLLNPGDYSLYLWIDMNDNFDTESDPEVGIDMTHTSLPVIVTIDGDTTVTIIASDFELYLGLD